MAEICRKSPIPVALDEELIGCRDTKSKIALLDSIKPQYIILKPSLCGGFAASEEWAALACERGIGWWATSALESDIGLNAIAQWCGSMNTKIPQGLAPDVFMSITSHLLCARLVTDCGMTRRAFGSCLRWNGNNVVDSQNN